MPLKNVFFAEDRPDTIFHFKHFLKEKGVIPENKETWDKVCSYIEESVKNKAEPDIVVIDVNIPITPDEDKKWLHKHSKELRDVRDLNQGQAFGLWLRDNYPKIPYVYLTNMPSVYNPEARDYQTFIKKIKARDFILPKSTAPKDFYRKIEDICNNWDSVSK